MTTLIPSNHDWNIIDRDGLKLALQEAWKSYQEGGIPIGSVLILPDKEASTGFMVLGAGHNERIQKQSPTLHGEISALENAGRQKPETYRNSVLVSSPRRLQRAMYD
jgi:cytosine deaminase